MKSLIIGEELFISKKVENINKYDIKLLKLFKQFKGYYEVPMHTIIKELRTNNKFVYQYIDNTNKKINKYGMRIIIKGDDRNKVCILEEDDDE